jgi:hypothetical protein
VLGDPLAQLARAHADVAEHRAARQDHARRAGGRDLARLLTDVSKQRPAADLDHDALGHEQLDVAEDRAGIDRHLGRRDPRLAQVEDDVAE